jgi:hypothetical protein
MSSRMFNWACLLLCLSGVSAWAPNRARLTGRAMVASRAEPIRDSVFGLSRRALLVKTASAVAPVLLAAPSVAMAASGTEQLGLERCVYLILRVQEATQQVPHRGLV